MSKHIGATLATLGLAWAATVALAEGPNHDPEITWVPGQVIVGFEAVPQADTIAAVHAAIEGPSTARELPHAPHYKNQPGVPHPLALVRVFEVSKDADILALADQLAALPGVRYAEPNYESRIAFVPNDPDYDTEQYGPQIIRAEEAWDTTLGDSSVVLAIADTGFNYSHEDLAAGLYVNPDETLNGIDDDGNGFIDDINGWDFYNNDNDMSDFNGHGSHVAGIAAARTNNSTGMAGMAQVRIMPLQVFSSGGGGTWEAIANAVFYATDNDVQVLNYSGGGGGGSSLLADAVEYAWDGGMPVVAAAGNGNTSSPHYPAAYPDCLAISGTDRFDNRYNSSHYGSWIDVAAPGVDVYSCYWSGTSSYVNLTGTSMSSPHAAGLVALMYSVDPDLTPQEVRDLLRDNAVDLGDPGFDQFFGYGRIDAAATLNALANCDGLEITDQPDAQNACYGDDVSFSVATNFTDPVYQWKKDGVDLVDGGDVVGANTATLTILGVQPGDEAQYSCQIEDLSSGCLRLSDSAELTLELCDTFAHLVQNDTEPTEGADLADFNRNVTHFTFDLTIDTVVIPTDWLASEIAVDVVGSGRIWHASDETDLGEPIVNLNVPFLPEDSTNTKAFDTFLTVPGTAFFVTPSFAAPGGVVSNDTRIRGISGQGDEIPLAWFDTATSVDGTDFIAARLSFELDAPGTLAIGSGDTLFATISGQTVTPFDQEGEDFSYELYLTSGGGCPNAGCDLGDLDGDCDVDLEDLSTLLAEYGTVYDLEDLASLLSQFGNDCN